MLAKNRVAASRPWYSKGSGGMEMKTSSVSNATRDSRSEDSYAATNLSTISSREDELASDAGRNSRDDRKVCSRVARARLRALFTESVVESSISETSLARNPSTSRK